MELCGRLGLLAQGLRLLSLEFVLQALQFGRPLRSLGEAELDIGLGGGRFNEPALELELLT